MRFLKHILLILAVLVLPAPARSEPISISYNGDDFPEYVGWERHAHGDGGVRSLADGVLTLDSMYSRDIVDYYQQTWSTDPIKGELFIAEARMRVTEQDFFPENGIGIARADSYGYVEVLVGLNSLIVLPSFVEVPLTPAEWHTITIRSWDMHAFDLYIDGSLAHSGQFESETLNRGFCAFGDPVRGASSHTEWDYVYFSIVPEPAPSIGLMLFSLPTVFNCLIKKESHSRG